VGGALTGTVGWRWVFWLLTILSASCLFLVAAFLPETCRNIVGNGSIPATGLNRSTFGRNGGLDHPAPDGGSAIVKPNLRFPNPFPCLRIVFHKDTGLVLVSNAIFYTIYSCVQASLSTLFAKIYHLNPIQVGLCYLAYGIGCAIASYGTGKIIDRDYQKTASAIGHSINKIAGDDLTKFPIERARLRSIFWFITIAVACTLGYGWTLHARTHISAPLILQFCCGLTVTGTFNVSGTVLLRVMQVHVYM
jgi:predicted MFS family arabinose efflux permease